MVGAKIKKYLDDNGIKQSFLVEKTGLSASIISNICIHDRKVGADEYYLICKALNRPLDFFMSADSE